MQRLQSCYVRPFFLVLQNRKTVDLAAIDSTGFESRHVSQYFLQRKQGNELIFARFHPKLVVICDCQSHAIVGFLATRGPKPDNPLLKPTLDRCVDVAIEKLLADAGFDGD